MKKVLLALLVILTASILIFAVGCDSNGPPTPIAKGPGPTSPGPTSPGPTSPGPTSPGPTAPVVLFDLEEVLDSVAVGETDGSVIFTGGKWAAAGGVPANVIVEVVDVAGKKGLYVQTVSSWAGFDLNDSGLSFADGYKISIAGTWGAGADGKQILLNLDHNGWAPLDSWNPTLNEDDPFSHDFTLTQADVDKITAADPQAIRIRSNAAATFTVTKLIVTDK